jgi:flavin reductase (DIM6/NTAB) family NADH-FMN oxidoreductase RutF
MATTDRREAEAALKRSQRHGDFKQLEASRLPFGTTTTLRYTQTPNPFWKFGDGANHLHAQASSTAATAEHVSIDPYATDRSMFDNYKLLVSGVVPRPIAFISTRSRDGSSENLAPMSFFQLVNVDPPIFAIAVTSPLADAKDTLHNLLETREVVINIVSEGFVEAVNATSINAPYGVSEWDISGLTPVYDCQTVKCARVKEAVFSIEAKLEGVFQFTSRLNPGTKSGSLELVEASHFWVREDAINDEKNLVDLAVSWERRPVYTLLTQEI